MDDAVLLAVAVLHVDLDDRDPVCELCDPGADLCGEGQERRARDRARAAIARSLALRAGCRADEAAFVLFALPIALVQQHQPGSAPPSVTDLGRRLAARFMGR